MGFSCGFVGLPNVGKSTLFNALTKAGAEAANFPFCTIEPNTGIVPVPDKRLDILSEMHKSKKIVPAVMKFIDIAGLVGGSSQGQGLGNKFLGHIRNVDAIAHIVRLFDDENVTHVSGKVDPVSDIETIITELTLSDLEVVERRIERINKKIRSGDKDVAKEMVILKSIYDVLADGSIPEYDENKDRNTLLKELNLLSTLPAFICANVDENILADGIKEFIKGLPIYEFAKKHNMEIIPICAKLEEEIIELSPEDAKVFMEELSMTESGLNKIIKTGYKILNYITFLTTGPDETRAWTITRNMAAPQAAGKIHTDMERGFIRMEVVAYNDILEYGSEVNAKSAGKMRIEGKDYIVKDGDVINVRFSV